MDYNVTVHFAIYISLISSLCVFARGRSVAGQKDTNKIKGTCNSSMQVLLVLQLSLMAGNILVSQNIEELMLTQV